MVQVMNLKNPYDRVELIGAVNRQPYLAHELEQWLPWNVEGVTTRDVFIDVSYDGSLSILEESDPRAPKRDYVDKEDWGGFSLRIPYYVQYDSVIAEAVQGRRAFGSATEAMTYLTELTKVIDRMKARNALTREFLRAGALQGKLYKKDGTISQDLHQKAGTSPTTKAIALGTTSTDLIQELTDAKQQIEEKLGAYAGLASGYMLIAGSAIHPKLARHASVKEAFRLWSATGAVGNLGSALRDDLRAGFPITTDINLVSNWKGKIGNTFFLDPNKALLCPIIPGLYQTRYAPGTGKDVVNTVGIPEYALIEPLGFNKGDEVQMEMAVVSYMEKQEVVNEITSSN